MLCGVFDFCAKRWGDLAVFLVGGIVNGNTCVSRMVWVFVGRF